MLRNRNSWRKSTLKFLGHEGEEYEHAGTDSEGTNEVGPPGFRSGDTVKVHVRIVEGTRERIQVFEGVVIGINRKGAGTSFTVRKISYGVGVERVFPLHSPMLDKIEVVSHGRVRRSKIYYIRKLRGKAARIKERVTRIERSPSRGLVRQDLPGLFGS